MASIPDAPSGEDLEWSVGAALQTSGYYIDKNVVDEYGGTQFLELDVVATRYDSCKLDTLIVEVKSGSDWNFTHLFQLRGRMVYRGIDKGLFFTSQCSATRHHVYVEVANRLGISLAVCDDTRNQRVEQALENAGATINYDEEEHEFWRFAYWAERNLMKLIRERHDAAPSEATTRAKEYRKLVNDKIFFIVDPLERANGLYEAYSDFPQLSRAAAASYLGANATDDEINTAYSEAMKLGKYPLVQSCLYLEHRARLAILRAAVDYACFTEKRPTLGLLSLPANFSAIAEELAADEYAPRYPYLWQAFFWSWGAFIALPKKDEEYEILARQTGIPADRIDNALAVYDRLFPIDGGWWQPRGQDTLQTLKLVPPSIYGMGAIRRFLRHKIKYYEELAYGGSSAYWLAKWHNLAIALIERKGLYAAP